MRTPAIILATLTLLTLGCNDSPRTQEQVRHETAAATATVASDIKGAALGIRDGLHTARGGPGYDLVNINTATRLRLMTLPGLTSLQAKAIIAHRPYSDPADLQRRRVIPADEFDKIADRLTTTPPQKKPLP